MTLRLLLCIWVCAWGVTSNGQERPAKAAPVPGPMLDQGVITFDTPQSTLKLVRSSQTVAALLPKGTDGFDFTRAIGW